MDNPIAEHIRRLADEYNVSYIHTSDDAISNVLTELSNDNVTMDDVELLLLALERAGAIASSDVVPMHVHYLREKFGGIPS